MSTDIEKPDVIGATRRAETIRQGMISYAAALEALGDAFEARDWVALGHKDWDTYCEKEFSEKRLKLTREQREQAVLAFRHAGMSIRAIGAALGVSVNTVQRDLSQSDTPAAITGADGKTYPATKTSSDTAVPRDGEEDAADHGGSAASSEPRQPSGLGSTSPDAESGTDRPATAAPDEAEEFRGSPAADGDVTSANQTGTASSPEEHGPVEPERAVGVPSAPATKPEDLDEKRVRREVPEWLVAITNVITAVDEFAALNFAEVSAAVDEDLFGDFGLAVSKLDISYAAMSKQRQEI